MSWLAPRSPAVPTQTCAADKGHLSVASDIPVFPRLVPVSRAFGLVCTNNAHGEAQPVTQEAQPVTQLLVNWAGNWLKDSTTLPSHPISGWSNPSHHLPSRGDRTPVPGSTGLGGTCHGTLSQGEDIQLWVPESKGIEPAWPYTGLSSTSDQPLAASFPSLQQALHLCPSLHHHQYLFGR